MNHGWRFWHGLRDIIVCTPEWLVWGGQTQPRCRLRRARGPCYTVELVQAMLMCEFLSELLRPVRVCKKFNANPSHFMAGTLLHPMKNPTVRSSSAELVEYVL